MRSKLHPEARRTASCRWPNDEVLGYERAPIANILRGAAAFAFLGGCMVYLQRIPALCVIGGTDRNQFPDRTQLSPVANAIPLVVKR
jgi:hypothetical protein